MRRALRGPRAATFPTQNEPAQVRRGDPGKVVERGSLRVRVAFWRHGTSRELRWAADEFVELDPSFDRLTRVERGRTRL
jgi:hypothetical protein